MAKHGKGRRRRLGREAIELLKNAYRDGSEFADIYAVRAFVITELGVKAAFVPFDSARNWDRTARLENADDGYASTFPSRTIGFKRSPNADATERSASHGTDYRYIATRGGNALRSAKASASQSDANRREIERAARLEIVAPLLQHLVELDG
jgi:hypothetical protein